MKAGSKRFNDLNISGCSRAGPCSAIRTINWSGRDSAERQGQLGNRSNEEMFPGVKYIFLKIKSR